MPRAKLRGHPVEIKKKNKPKTSIVDAACALMRSHPGQDYTIDVLAEELDEQGHFERKSYEELRTNYVRHTLRSSLRAAKKNVGTKDEPVKIRRCGSYVVTVVIDGKDADVWAWNEWEQMSWVKRVHALRALYDQVKAAKKEADNTFTYVNILNAHEGQRAITLSDVGL